MDWMSNVGVNMPMSEVVGYMGSLYATNIVLGAWGCMTSTTWSWPRAGCVDLPGRCCPPTPRSPYAAHTSLPTHPHATHT